MINNAPESSVIEQNSLELGKWANLFMAVAGVATSYLSHSDALLVDGLYSGVNFFSAIIAARITAAVACPADRRYPFGYEVLEALYVKYRALVLLGIMAFASLGAVQKIIAFSTGSEVPELVFGPILIYAIVMVSICLSLSAWHHYNWKRSGGRSEILRTESKAAIVDGAISGGAGGTLFAASLLEGTAIDIIIPIADSIVVLGLCVVLFREPVSIFVRSLREVAGQSADASLVEKVKTHTQELFKGKPFTVLDVAVTKMGRRFFVVPYLKPDQLVNAGELDALRQELATEYTNLLGDTSVELVITTTSPLAS